MEAWTRLAGWSEAALRAPALLASCAGLLLTWRWTRAMVGARAGLWVVGFLACSPSAVHYAAEVKPYAFDCAAAIAVGWGAWGALGERFRARAWALLVLGGALGLWVSLPLVFPLAAAALAGISRCWRQRAALAAVLAGAGLWAALFWGLQRTAYAHVTEANYGWLYAYWEQHFAPWPPRALADLAWWVRSAERLLAGPLGLAWMAWPGVALVALGAWRWSRRAPLAACLGSGALVGAWAASAAGRYPFDGRLVLFLAPAAALLVAQGCVGLAPEQRAARIGLALALGSPLAWHAGKVLVAPHRLVYREELRPALEALSDARRPSEQVLLNSWAEPAWRHYAPRVGLGDLEPRIAQRVEEQPLAFARALDAHSGSGAVWVLLTHYEDGGDGLARYLEPARSRWGAPTVERAFDGAWLGRFEP